MLRVIIQSPFSGNFTQNIRYARLCLLDSLKRGEAPLASHLLYTLSLDDRDPEQREKGMNAGFEWSRLADRVAVYEDLGVSTGMKAGIKRAEELRIPVESRTLPKGMLGDLCSMRNIGTKEMVERL